MAKSILKVSVLAALAVMLIAPSASADTKLNSVSFTGVQPAQVETDPTFIYDDGTCETNVGLTDTSAGTSSQFMWFNLYPLAGNDPPLHVDTIDIFWTGSDSVFVGCAIELVVFDTANPAAGGTLIHNQDDALAAVDQFDSYALGAHEVPGTSTSIALGVVDRWVSGSYPGLVYPAAQDQDSSNYASWVAWESDLDIPVPPSLPTGNIAVIDDFGLVGNWMIRGAATTVPVELQSFVVE